ncbi:MAG TPA: hypothetical protein VGJ13_04530 [Pseudonocardiaceae bacterium]|jgi:hypothetical protein
MTMIAVLNKSDQVSDDDVRTMVRVCAHQLRYDAEPVWQRGPLPIAYVASEQAIQPGSWVIAILNDADQAGALGYHTEGSDGTIWGRVFTSPSLDAGSTALTGPYAISSVLSHEALEIYVDPSLDFWGWADTDQAGNPVLVATEVCDPVEDHTYLIRDLHTGQDVTVSDFVTPAWFNPQAPSESTYSCLNSIDAPYTITAGGYAVVWRDGKHQQVFGDEMPSWRRDTKQHELSRGSRRSATPQPPSHKSEQGQRLV